MDVKLSGFNAAEPINFIARVFSWKMKYFFACPNSQFNTFINTFLQHTAIFTQIKNDNFNISFFIFLVYSKHRLWELVRTAFGGESNRYMYNISSI